MSTKKTKRAKLMAKAVKKQPKKVVKKEKTFEMYRVDMEQPEKNSVGYSFVIYKSEKGVDEQVAQSLAQTLKQLGVGGRIVQLDGTPEGNVVETWGSVGRVIAAAEVEKPALERVQ